MDPVTSFALAAGVLQVVEFSLKAVKTCHELYKEGSLADTREAQDVMDELAKATDRLSITTNQATTPLSQDDLEMVDLSDKCSKLSKDLHKELDNLTVNRQSLRQSVSKGVLAIRRKKFIKEKQDLLERHQSVLATHILTRLDTRSVKATHGIHLLDQNVQELIHALDNGQSIVETLFADQNREIRELRDHFDNQFESYTRCVTDHDTHQRFLESLFFPEINMREEKITDAFDQTCRWIFDEPTDERRGRDPSRYNFRDWLRSGNGVYWISGKPGSGKSTLMKFLVNEELTEQLLDAGKGNQELLIISFFFWTAGNALQKSVSGVLRSLLYQIARRCPELVDIARTHSSKSTYGLESSTAFRTAWTDQRLLSVLDTFIDQMPAHLSLCAFVDGLDEFVGNEDLLLDMVRLFSKASQCKICVSSRPEQAFRHEFRECPRLRMQDFNHEDIRRTATSRLKPVLEKHLDTSKHSYTASVAFFVYTLISKASGVFLWLDLMVKELVKGAKNGDTIEQLQSRLERTPATIEGLYAHILENLDPIYHEEGLRYFSILLSADELEIPVTLLRLVCAQGESWKHADKFDLEYFATTHFESTCQRLENRLGACCGGLIDISDKEEENSEDRDWTVEDMEVEERKRIIRGDRTIGFTHKTAMEYVRERLNDLQGLSSHVNAMADLARGGIGFLTILSSRHRIGVKAEATQIFGESFENTMHTICASGHPVVDLKISELSESFQVELTNRMFWSLQGIHNRSYQSTQEFWSNKSFMTDLVYSAHSESAGVHFQDRLSVAAYYGCNHYLSCQPSMDSIKKEHATNLLQSTLWSIDTDLAYHSVSRYKSILPKLLAVQLVVQHTFNPKKPYFTTLEPYVTTLEPYYDIGMMDTEHLTLWVVFFSLLSKILNEVPRYIAGVALPAYEECSFKLVKAFLLQGADPNTKIPYRNDLSTSGPGFYTLVGVQSPLALIGNMTSSTSSELCSKLEARLKSAGAVIHQDFLYLIKSGHEYYPLWRLSDAQKERLDDILWCDSSVDVGHEIDALLEEIDGVDEAEVERYMDTLGHSFSDN
ncbi:MAG: hypothetical protein Q9170_001972 [Blastenia crenularia]